MDAPVLEPKPVRILNIDEKQETQYCIPLWLRDEQIRINVAKVKDRLQPVEPSVHQGDRIACVSFGPSLNDTWEQLRDFKYILTCSGAHKFLVERGIIPTWHTDLDPRAHKIKLIGTPHPDVEYLLASTVHPDLSDWLLASGVRVKLWHIFDNSEDGYRVLPHGDWAITGGCSVGLRTLTLAAILGFRDLHVFGMDGNQRDDVGKHAAEHPNQPKGHSLTIFDGVEYKTTPAMLEAARQTPHEVDNMPECKIQFYGEGLVQHIMRKYVRKPPQGEVLIGFTKQPVISEEYRLLNEQLHEKNLAYGVGGKRHADTVRRLYKILQKKTEFVSILDYGCGKGYLGKTLGFPIFEYDPAVPGKKDPPRAADLVVCADVLEHVEPECIGAVLMDLARCVRQLGFFVIDTKEATKVLADGRNTHLLLRDRDWWANELAKFFKIGEIRVVGRELFCIVTPKKK